MVAVIVRRLVVVLSVLAFIGGTTIQAIPSAEALGLSAARGNVRMDPKCPRMAMDHPGNSVPVPLPCKGIMLDCVKQMGCLGIAALPDRSDAAKTPVTYSFVTYWAPGAALAGRSVEPDLFPPIAG